MIKIDNKLKNLIEKNALCLTTVKNNKPHAIAVAYAKVIKNKILITDNFMKETKGNLKENNNVALAVWNRNWEKNCIGFEIKGKAKYFSSGKWREFVKKIPENKKYSAKGAILITISKIKKLA
jgi:predicted pyridoxine 5'-phosphate oxidase superfamily flavin-nucleotide-binding protein